MNFTYSHAACCSVAGRPARIHTDAPPTMLPPFLALGGFGKYPVPSWKRPPMPVSTLFSAAVESHVIAVCPAANARWLAAVGRPGFVATPFFTMPAHHSRIRGPSSSWSYATAVASASRPLPLFTYRTPWRASNCSKNHP